METEWITTTEAAQLSGYHVNHIRRLIRDGTIKAKKFGYTLQVSRSSLLAYMRQAEQAEDKRWGARRKG